MYDMYPDAWPLAAERRQQPVVGERPRRRTRKQPAVLPALVTPGQAQRGRFA
jgi:hypothetical protein